LPSWWSAGSLPLLACTCMRMGPGAHRGWWGIAGMRNQSSALHHVSREPPFSSHAQQHMLNIDLACGRWLGVQTVVAIPKSDSVCPHAVELFILPWTLM
jgi:hypothetical protein